jgi:hypothetical protein
MSEAKDLDGRTISVGDRIAYPGRQGSSLWMTKAKVLEIYEGKDWRDNPFTSYKVEREVPDEPKYSWSGPPRKIVHITNIQNVVKL